MSRGRQWRRALAERKFNRTRRYMFERYSFSFQTGSQTGWTGSFSYMKRNSIDETVMVRVRSEQQFQEFLSHSARIARDNPKLCSCDHCSHMRGGEWGRAWNIFTLAEKKSFRKFTESVLEADIRPRNFNWRRRGRCRQRDYDPY